MSTSASQAHQQELRFNYHVICPLTTSDSITLVGLNSGDYNAHQVLRQMDCNGVIVAEGLVVADAQVRW